MTRPASDRGPWWCALGLLPALVLATLLGAQALAVEPGERLSDPALEARARVLSKELRCVVCQNESIDTSNADIARDLRLLVRERLAAGDSDEEVMDYVVERYGDFVLMTPPMRWDTAALWFGPLALLLIFAAIMGLYLRRRGSVVEVGADPLSAEERARLEALRGGREASPDGRPPSKDG